MTEAEYCKDICGARCCFKIDKELTVRCPKLNYDQTCSCYAERFAPHMDDLVYVGSVEINKQRKVDFICTRISKLIESKQLPQEIEDQCCVAHPELLKAPHD